MIDHLMRCATPEAAKALIKQYGAARAFGCRVILTPAEWDMTDPENPVEVQPEVLAEGHFVWIALTEISPSLAEALDNACRLIADRAAALAQSPDFILYTAPDLEPGLIETATIEPVPAGAGYPFRSI